MRFTPIMCRTKGAPVSCGQGPRSRRQTHWDRWSHHQPESLAVGHSCNPCILRARATNPLQIKVGAESCFTADVYVPFLSLPFLWKKITRKQKQRGRGTSLDLHTRKCGTERSTQKEQEGLASGVGRVERETFANAPLTHGSCRCSPSPHYVVSAAKSLLPPYRADETYPRTPIAKGQGVAASR